jgi:aspartate/methionine/tyrosine aminotransferase
MSEEFHRIRRLPPYVFAEVNAAKAKARAAAVDIIDLGMGSRRSPIRAATAIRHRRAFPACAARWRPIMTGGSV